MKMYFQIGVLLILSSPKESAEDLQKVMNIVEYKQDSTRIRTDP